MLEKAKERVALAQRNRKEGYDDAMDDNFWIEKQYEIAFYDDYLSGWKEVKKNLPTLYKLAERNYYQFMEDMKHDRVNWDKFEGWEDNIDRHFERLFDQKIEPLIREKADQLMKNV